MINVVGSTVVKLPMIIIEWAPKHWNQRKAWGPGAIDGFYMTREGEIYRLCGNTVIYVTKMEYLH